MLLETLLPLGKVDPGLRAPEVPFDLHSIGENARLLEDIGYDGLVVEETKDDPFIVMALAAQATRKLKIGTSVAIAFPRSPTVTAMSAWTLQKLSRGRFTLGLGTQVKAHIERRFGLPWTPAGPWMREYVHAVRAVWDNWQNGTPLDVKGAALQHQSHGAAVQSRPDRASAHSDPDRGRQLGDVPGRRRSGRRHPPASGLHALLHRAGDDAGGSRRRRQGRPLARRVPGRHEAAGRHGRQRGRARPQGARRAGAHRLLRLDAAVPRRLRPSRPRRPRRPAETAVAGAALGRDCRSISTTISFTPSSPSAPTTRSAASSASATARSSPTASSRSRSRTTPTGKSCAAWQKTFKPMEPSHEVGTPRSLVFDRQAERSPAR